MADVNIRINPGSRKQTDDFFKALLNNIGKIELAMDNLSSKDIFSQQSLAGARQAFSKTLGDIKGIVDSHNKALAASNEGAARGTEKAFNKIVDSSALQETTKKIRDLQTEMAKAIGNAQQINPAASMGEMSASLKYITAQMQAMTDQMAQMMSGSSDTTKNFQDAEAQIRAIADGYKTASDNSATLNKNVSAISGGIQDMADGTASTVSQFKEANSAASQYIGSIENGVGYTQDLTASYEDMGTAIGRIDIERITNPDASSLDDMMGLSNAEEQIQAIADGSSAVQENLSGAASSFGEANSASEDMAEVWKAIANSVSAIPEMLTAMRSLVGMTRQFAASSGEGSKNIRQTADSWQNAILDVISMRDATRETAEAMHRMYSAEMMGDVDRLEQSTALIDEYWNSIYQNSKMASMVNQSVGGDVFNAAPGSAAIMKHINFARRIMLEQETMSNKARAMQFMAQDQISKNNEAIASIQEQWDSLENRKQASTRGDAYLMKSERDLLKADQDNLKKQQDNLRNRNRTLGIEQRIFGVVHKVGATIEDVLTKTGKLEDRADGRSKLEEKIAWAQQQQNIYAEKMEGTSSRTNDQVGQLVLKSQRLDEYWGGLAANFKTGEDTLGRLLESGLVGSLSHVSVLKTARNLLEQQDNAANRIQVLRFLREERVASATKEISGLEKEWRQIEGAINDHTMGMISLTEKELRNLRERQKTLDRQKGILAEQVKGMEKEGRFEKVGYIISDSVNRVMDLFRKSDQYSAKAKKVEQQLNTMREQRSRIEKEGDFRTRSMLEALTSAYSVQEQSGLSATKQAKTLEDVYGKIESISERIAGYWQQMVEMMAKLTNTSLGDASGMEMTAAASEKQVSTVEKIATQLGEARQFLLKNFFGADFIKRVNQEMGTNFTTLAEMMADPKAFKAYEQEMQKTIRNILSEKAGISSEMAASIAGAWMPTIEMIDKAAASGEKLAESGYIHQGGGSKEEIKTRDIDQIMRASQSTQQSVADAAQMTNTQMADAIVENAPRIAAKYNEEFFKTFLKDPAAWAEQRHGFVMELGAQIAAVTGQTMEFGYAIANDLLPSIDAINKAGGDIAKLDLNNIGINRINVVNPEQAKAEMLNQIIEANSNQAQNKELMINRGELATDRLSQEQAKAMGAKSASSFRNTRDWLESKRGRKDQEALQARVDGLRTELLDIEARIQEAANQGNKVDVAKLTDNKAMVEAKLMQAEQEKAEQTNITNQTQAGRRNIMGLVKRAAQGMRGAAVNAVKGAREDIGEALVKVEEYVRVDKKIARELNEHVKAPLEALGQGLIEKGEQIRKRPLKALADTVLDGVDTALKLGQAIEEKLDRGKEKNRLSEAAREAAATKQMSDYISKLESEFMADGSGNRGAMLDAVKQRLVTQSSSSGLFDNESLKQYLDTMKAIPDDNARTLEQVSADAISQLGSIRSAMESTTDPEKLMALKEMEQTAINTVEEYKSMRQDNLKFTGDDANQWMDRMGSFKDFMSGGDMTSVREKMSSFNPAEYIGQNFDQIQGKAFELGDKITEMSGKFGKFGGVAKGVGGVIQWVGKMLGPIMAGFQGIDAGLQIFDNFLGVTPGKIKMMANAIDIFSKNLATNTDLLMNASGNDIDNQKAQLEMQIKQADAELSVAQNAAMAMSTTRDKITTNISAFLFGDKKIYGELGQIVGEKMDNKNQLVAELSNLLSQEKLIKDWSAFKKTIQKADEALQSIAETELQRVQAMQDHDKEILQEQKDFQKQSMRDAEQKAMDTLFAEEDWATERINAYKDNLKSIKDTEDEFLKSVKDAEKSLNEARTEAYGQLQTSLADIDTEENKSVEESNKSFAEDQVKSHLEYLKQMFDSEDNYRRERIRREEDLYAQLRDLEMQNDVIGFLQAKNDAEKEFKRSDEDHKREMDDSAKNYEEQRAESQKAHEQEMADMKLQNAERRLELVVQFQDEEALRIQEHEKSLEEQRKNAQEQIEAQMEQYAISESEAWTRFDIDKQREEARTALQERYAEEDRLLQAQQREQAFQDQMKQIDEQEQVAINDLAAYYETQGMDRATALKKAQDDVKNANDIIQSNMTDHGINMAQLQIDQNAAIEQGQAEHNAVMLEKQSVFFDRMVAITNEAAQAAAQKAYDESQYHGVVGSFFDSIGASLTGLAAGAGSLVGLVGDVGGALFGQNTNYRTSNAVNVWKGLRGAATGGSFKKGEVIVVGEEGPELFMPHENGEIIPHGMSKQLVKQGVLKGFAGGTEGSGLMAVLMSLASGAQDAAQIIGGGFSNLFTGIQNEVGAFIGNIGDGSAIGEVKNIWEGAKQSFEQLRDMGPSMMDSALTQADEVGGGLLSQITNVVSQAQTSAQQLWILASDSVSTVVKDAFDGFNQISSGALEDLSKSFSNTVSSGLESLEKTASGLVEGATTVIGDIGSFIGDVGGGIADMVNGAVGGIGNFLGGILPFAAGGQVQKQKLSLVGEEGPELYFPGMSRAEIMQKQADAAAYASYGSTISPRNMTSIDWTSGRPRAVGGGIKKGGIEKMPTYSDLVVSSGHYQPGIQGEVTDSKNPWEAQLNAMDKTDNKIFETQSKISDIQKQFQEKMTQIQGTVGDYHSKIGGLDTKRLDSLYHTTYDEHEKELDQRKQFADKLINEGNTYNEDEYKNLLDQNELMLQTGGKGYDELLAQFGLFFTDSLDTLSTGEGDVTDIFKILAKSGVDLLSGLNEDGTFEVDGFVNGVLKSLGKLGEFLGVAPEETNTLFQGFLNGIQNLAKQITGKQEENNDSMIEGEQRVGEKRNEIIEMIANTVNSSMSNVKDFGNTLNQAALRLAEQQRTQQEVEYNKTMSVYQRSLKDYQSHKDEMSLEERTAYETQLSLLFEKAQEQRSALEEAAEKEKEVRAAIQAARIEQEAVFNEENVALTQEAHTGEIRATETHYTNMRNTVDRKSNEMGGVVRSAFNRMNTDGSNLGRSLQNVGNVMGLLVGRINEVAAAIQTAVSRIQAAMAAVQAAMMRSSSSSGGSSHTMGGGGSITGGGSNRGSWGGARAVGGAVTRNRNYLVGEFGPELFMPDKNGNIIPYIPNSSLGVGRVGGINGRVGQSRSNQYNMTMDRLLGPKNLDKYMFPDTRQPINMPTKQGIKMTLKIDNLKIGADMTRAEVETQMRKLQSALVETFQEAVG